MFEEHAAVTVDDSLRRARRSRRIQNPQWMIEGHRLERQRGGRTIENRVPGGDSYVRAEPSGGGGQWAGHETDPLEGWQAGDDLAEGVAAVVRPANARPSADGWWNFTAKNRATACQNASGSSTDHCHNAG